MTKILTAAALLGAALTLNGCLFFYIPGEVISAAGDAVTGAQGGHCVLSTVHEGDRVLLPGGGMGKVQKVSTSGYRCASGKVRAEVVPL